MQLTRGGLSLAAISVLTALSGPASAKSVDPFCGLTAGPYESTEALLGEPFIGAPVSANPLHPRFDFKPRSATLHADGANARLVDYPGPLGANLSINTVNIAHSIFFWDSHGTMFSAYGGPCNGNTSSIVRAIGVVDPETLEYETVWQPPAEYANTVITPTYMQLLVETDEIVITSQEGQIYVLEMCRDAQGAPSIEIRRLIDLVPTGVLQGYTLLTSLMDSAGNLWFSTGVVHGAGSTEPTPLTVIGYVEPDGTIHSIEIPNQTVENGLAVSDTTVFFNTAPSAEDDHANAIGYMGALRPGTATSVEVAWNSTYQAGSRQKKGAFARGAGTTPGLLGNDFVCTTDNDDAQMNLLIFRQNGTGTDNTPVCTVPLFQPNASWTDNAAIVHYDGTDYSVVVQNMFNQTGPSAGTGDIDGAATNNLTVQYPGITKVFVAGNGSGCHVEWTNPGRMTAAPMLSTATGLIYGYEQSEELAIEGQYIWYATAIDFVTGKTVWKARTGAGGKFNNSYKTTFLSPNGTMYQPVLFGVTAIRDGEVFGGDHGGYHGGPHGGAWGPSHGGYNGPKGGPRPSRGLRSTFMVAV